MVTYTPTQLAKRKTIIESHKLLTPFLNKNAINNLLHLFDPITEGNTSPDNKIIYYIDKERQIRGLDSDNMKITSSYYDYEYNNSTYHIQIEKNGADFLHLTIHVVPANFKPNKTGLIHFVKDVYGPKSGSGLDHKETVSLILVTKPPGKNFSLEFSIAYDYDTPNMNKFTPTESQITQERDVIITVLNRIFDEDNIEYYIGCRSNSKNCKININMKKLNKPEEIPLNNMNSFIETIIPSPKINPIIYNKIQIPHSKANPFIKPINLKINHVTRNNRGQLMEPEFTTSPIKYYYNDKPKRKKSNRTTRKKQKHRISH
jgi:hypothetical protein